MDTQAVKSEGSMRELVSTMLIFRSVQTKGISETENGKMKAKLLLLYHAAISKNNSKQFHTIIGKHFAKIRNKETIFCTAVFFPG